MTDILFKKGGVILFFLSLIIHLNGQDFSRIDTTQQKFVIPTIALKGQNFSRVDTIVTTISAVTYRFLPIQSEKDFNFLFYSMKDKKQNFELITVKDTSISRIEIKNQGLEGGGSWYTSAVISNEILLLLHVDGFLVVYEKNKKGIYAFKERLNIKGRKFSTISLLNSENVLLMNDYNYDNKKKLYDNYALCVFNLRTKKILYSKEMDLGKGILLSHFSSTVLTESKKSNIAVAHPTLPFIYIYNEKLDPIDTVYAKFQHAISVDSVINAVFTDSFLKPNKYNAKGIIETIEYAKIDQMERIEKVFWLTDDILGYTIRQPFLRAKIFVFYSVSEKKELHKKIEFYSKGSETAYNFTSSTRILINNNKTIWYHRMYEKDESDFYYVFDIYDILPFNSTK